MNKMIVFQLIINWSEHNTTHNSIIDCIKVPLGTTDIELQEIFELFLNNITNKFNTVEKCLRYMQEFSFEPFINNFIDRPYTINYIDINTTVVNNSIFSRDNENFILQFNKPFEIIRDDYNEYSWRL